MRPIALLPVMGKILEKTIIKINQAQLVENFSLNQHADCPVGSCTSAIVDMHDTVTSMLDQTSTHAVRLVFLNMCAAFDKLRHDKILQRMIDCNFNPTFINWCKSYLQYLSALLVFKFHVMDAHTLWWLTSLSIFSSSGLSCRTLATWNVHGKSESRR